VNITTKYTKSTNGEGGMEFDALSNRVIAGAIEVQGHPGPGLLAVSIKSSCFEKGVNGA
jgi:hypothetical protein